MVVCQGLFLTFFVLPYIVSGSHYFIEGCALRLTDDVGFNLVVINAAPFVLKSHHKTKGDSVLVGFFNVILPEVSQDDVS